MRRAFLPILALMLATPLAQGEGPADETRFTLRHEMLRMINHDRAAYGLRPVELDPETSTIADSYCRQQIRNGTTGHFTIDGQSPYMRYSFAGGNDGVSENAAAWSATYTFSDRALYEMIRRSEEAMMAEKAPHDGHRRTILDPSATHVGIGLAWEKGEFRLTQEFLRRYLEWSRPLPRAAGLYEDVTAAAKPQDGYRVEAISVHHEPIPRSLAASVANLIDSYRLPDERREYLPRLRSFARRTETGAIEVVREQYSDGRRGDFTINNDGSFRFNVPFADGPGVYTVVIWVKRPGDREPVAASNVSIRVDRPMSGFSGGGSR
jgi:uncharacterized protein YkwD